MTNSLPPPASHAYEVTGRTLTDHPSGGDGFSTTATNGAYSVGPNYNMVTGLGTPNVGKLIAALLVEPPSAPTIAVQPKSQSVTGGGTVSLSVLATGYPEPTYQWYVNGNAFAGATGSSLSFTNARASDSGEYTVVVTNSAGSVTSAKATVTVNVSEPPPPVTPPPSSGGGGGGGGGGGAPTPWFVLVLLVLGAARRFSRRGGSLIAG